MAAVDLYADSQFFKDYIVDYLHGFAALFLAHCRSPKGDLAFF
jgi:hypothetical protein